MKKNSWLDDFCEARTKKTVTASAKPKKKNFKTVASVDEANVIIVKKEMLKNAKDNDTVKYHNVLWKVVKASYSDSKGDGVVLRRIKPLKKVAAIDTKPLVSEPTRACNDPGNVFDVNERDEHEVPNMVETADATMEQIVAENEVDRTTPEGRYSPIEAVAPIKPFAEEVPAAEETPEAPVEEAPATEEITDEIPEETSTEETPAEEPVAEEPAVEEAPEPEIFDIELDDIESEEEEEEKKEEVATVEASAKSQDKFQRNPILRAMVAKKQK